MFTQKVIFWCHLPCIFIKIGLTIKTKLYISLSFLLSFFLSLMHTLEINMFINMSVRVCFFYYFPKILKISHFSSKWFSWQMVFQWCYGKETIPKWHRFQAAPAIQNVPLFIPYLINYRSFFFLLRWLLYCALVLFGALAVVVATVLFRRIYWFWFYRMKWSQRVRARTHKRANVRLSFIMLLIGWHHFLCLFLLNFDHVFYVNVCVCV